MVADRKRRGMPCCVCIELVAVAGRMVQSGAENFLRGAVRNGTAVTGNFGIMLSVAIAWARAQVRFASVPSGNLNLSSEEKVHYAIVENFMNFALVATTSHLLLVDFGSKEATPLENDRDEYYGISWFPESEELVLSHTGMNNSDLVDIATYAQSEVGWLSSGSRNSRKFLSAPHQLICAPDGRVVCTNTGRNVISVIDLNKPGIYQEAGLSDVRWDRLSLDNSPGDHLNSVFILDNKLFVIAHRFRKGAFLCTFAYPDLGLIDVHPLAPRTGLHNIWVTTDGQRISCDSDNGSIVDLDAKAPLWEAGLPIYTRGLAASGNYVVVGESQATGRDVRRNSLSGLWIIDRRTWQTVDYICLGPYGAVNEVRLLDTPDEVHHGIPFAGLRHLLDSDNMLVRISKEKLSANNAQHANRKYWAGYQKFLGLPEVLSNGELRAGPRNLCLLVKSTNDPVVSFNYNLDATADKPDSHVSVVLGYRGNGNDTHMVAFLLQPSGLSNATLTFWRHDGKAWVRMPDSMIHNLPKKGTLTLTTNEVKVVLKINRDEILRANAQSLGLECCNSGLGIRWKGAAVGVLK